MIYSVLYAHLNEIYVDEGQTVKYGRTIGKMGNTGQVIPKPTTSNPNAGTHLHLSVVVGEKINTWTLDSMTNTNVPNQQESLYFVENDIFNNKDRVLVTAGWLNYKNHYAYDIIPQNRKHYDIYWNRQFTGKVAVTGSNPGYGNYVIIHYDTREAINRQLPTDPKELESCKNNLAIKIDELNKINKTIDTQKDVINNQTIEIENLIKDSRTKNERINSLSNEKNILNVKIKQLEERLSQLPVDTPKLIFECPKDGIYTIKLRKGYKVYIKD
ncbi:MAG: peptidoglycan DD-metalloendopeptidase family protein [Bacilli bacterium]